MGVKPAEDVFDSTNLIIATIRVCPLLAHVCGLPTDVRRIPAMGGALCRTRADLRWGLSSP